jgi:hypothetical protein
MLSIGDLKKLEDEAPEIGRVARLSIGELEKAAATTGGIDLARLVAQIVAVLDFSGSMKRDYRLDLPRPSQSRVQPTPAPRRKWWGGRVDSAPAAASAVSVVKDPVDDSQVARAIKRALAVGATLDPDQVAQALFFDSVVSRAEHDINLGNYGTWLSQNLPNRQMGYTRLDLAVLETIRLAGEVLENPAIAQNAHLNGNWRPIGATLPMLVPLVTDGEPYDDRVNSEKLYERTRQAFRAASYCPIEFVILYVGRPDSPGEQFVDELDDLDGTLTDNVNVVKFTQGMTSVSDEKFASAVLKEFPGWAKSVRGLLLPADYAA